METGGGGKEADEGVGDAGTRSGTTAPFHSKPSRVDRTCHAATCNDRDRWHGWVLARPGT